MFQLRNLLLACVCIATLSACTAQRAGDIVQADACAMNESETVWVAHALEARRFAHREALHIDEAAVPPTIVFYNESCVFTGEGGAPWRGVAHDGAVTLPDGNTLPAQVASFASPYADNARVFFTMALPSIWQAGGVQSAEFGLDNLMTAVLIHEMTHTRQFSAYTPRLDALDRRYHLGDDLDDDIVQTTFHENAAYVAAYQGERDVFYRALAAPSDAEARRLTAEGLAMMRARRAHYFTGENEKLLPLEDIFLTMEGVAQWTAYAWLTNPRGGGFSEAVALPGMRRGGRQWSQDEGMVIFLLVDRLVPDWQARAFAAEPLQAMELLALAAGEPAH